MKNKILAGLIALILISTVVFLSYSFIKLRAHHGSTELEISRLNATIAALEKDNLALEAELVAKQDLDKQKEAAVQEEKVKVSEARKVLKAARTFKPTNMAPVQLSAELNKLHVASSTVTFATSAADSAVLFPTKQADWVLHVIKTELPALDATVEAQNKLIDRQEDLLGLRDEELLLSNKLIVGLKSVCSAEKQKSQLISEELEAATVWYRNPTLNLIAGVVIGGVAVAGVVAATN